MRQPGDRALLKAHFDQSNPYSLLSSVGNDGLLMFYCGSILKENIYYLKEEDAVAVASFEGDEMLCYDIFCDGRRPLQSVLRALAEKETRLVRFGFTPCETGNCSAHTLEGKEDTLFIYQGGENPFTKAQLMFPLLSHA